MKRKIIVNNKEFTMPKMSIDTYTEYLELAEVIDAKQRYSKQDIEAMGLFICKAYGDQFTVEELKNPETGLVEIVEIPTHPFFIGVQFHPEMKSAPEKPQPIFVHFVQAAMKKRQQNEKNC